MLLQLLVLALEHKSLALHSHQSAIDLQLNAHVSLIVNFINFRISSSSIPHNLSLLLEPALLRIDERHNLALHPLVSAARDDDVAAQAHALSHLELLMDALEVAPAALSRLLVVMGHIKTPREGLWVEGAVRTEFLDLLFRQWFRTETESMLTGHVFNRLNDFTLVIGSRLHVSPTDGPALLPAKL